MAWMMTTTIVSILPSLQISLYQSLSIYIYLLRVTKQNKKTQTHTKHLKGKKHTHALHVCL